MINLEHGHCPLIHGSSVFFCLHIGLATVAALPKKHRLAMYNIKRQWPCFIYIPGSWKIFYAYVCSNLVTFRLCFSLAIVDTCHISSTKCEKCGWMVIKRVIGWIEKPCVQQSILILLHGTFTLNGICLVNPNKTAGILLNIKVVVI